MFTDSLDKLVAQLEDGEALALLLDGPHVAVAKGGRLAHRLGLPLGRLVARQAYASQLLYSGESLRPTLRLPLTSQGD